MRARQGFKASGGPLYDTIESLHVRGGPDTTFVAFAHARKLYQTFSIPSSQRGKLPTYTVLARLTAAQLCKPKSNSMTRRTFDSDPEATIRH